MNQHAWDELGNLLFVGVALVLFVLIIWAGEKRNQEQQAAQKKEEEHAPYPTEEP